MAMRASTSPRRSASLRARHSISTRSLRGSRRNRPGTARSSSTTAGVGARATRSASIATLASGKRRAGVAVDTPREPVVEARGQRDRAPQRTDPRAGRLDRRDLHLREDGGKLPVVAPVRPTRERVEGDEPEGPHVARRAHLPLDVQLLGREPPRRPLRAGELHVRLQRGDDVRDAEVEHLHVEAGVGAPGLRHHDVLGLEVAVNHPDAVRGSGGVTHGVEDREHLLRRQRASGGAP